MAAGAVGFSTSRTLVHLSSRGEHVPTYQAATGELKHLGQVLSGEQGHVFQFISDWEDADDEFSILRDTSARTGARGTFTLLFVDDSLGGTSPAGEAGLWRQQLRRLEQAHQDGLDIRGQVLSRPLGIFMGHPGSMSSFYRRPTFLALADLPREERLAQLADPEIKAKILAEENDNPHVFVQFLAERYDMMYPMADPIEYLPDRNDTVAARAAREGRDPEEWLYDFFLENGGNNLVYIPAVNFSRLLKSGSRTR